MNYLFLHNNFPAQFRYLAAAIAAEQGNRVIFLTEHQRPGIVVPGVQLGLLPVPPIAASKNAAEYDSLTILQRGKTAAQAMMQLRGQGFSPDVIYDHCGWGYGLFSGDVFPRAARLSYCEWFYNKRFPYDLSAKLESQPAAFASQRMRNQCQLDALMDCHLGVCPTHWQRAQYPQALQSKLRVLHDGIDTNFFTPGRAKDRALPAGCFGLGQASELVTFTARGLEPCRGFPQFYRSLPALLKARPSCHVVIMGDDRVVYETPRPDGRSWLEAMRDEVDVDPGRVHVLNFRAYAEYLRLLRLSSVHVYMTVPYVLSWSLLEAMSTGCLVVASDTEPVREVVHHGVNGLLAPFGDHEALAAQVIEALKRREQLVHLRSAARQTILDRYSLKSLLPQHLTLLRDVLASRGAAHATI